jgi:hypothetical protein
MNNKITLDLNIGQVEQLVEKLPSQEKIRLVRKLEQETLRARWDWLLNTIDKRLKKYPISKTEIAREIKALRKARYAKSSG